MKPYRGALAALSLSTLLAALGTSIANVALPTLAVAFHASFQEAQWIVLAYLLAITTLVVGVGRLGDIVGRRRLLLLGIAVFAVASLACALAPTLAILIAARAAQGLGAAIMMALTMALVAEMVPKERTGGAMGLLGTMSAAGTALGPSLGGALIAGPGWRAIFLVMVPLAIAAWLLALRYLPRAGQAHPTRARSEFDVAGTALLAITVGTYALAMTTGRGHFGPLNILLLVAAAVGAGVFVRVESQASTPLLRVAMFRDAGLTASLAMSALVSTVMMATLVVGPFYLSRALALDAARVGLVMSIGPVVVALMGIPAGRIADRLGAARMTSVGLVGIAMGALLLFALPTSLGIAGYVGAMVVMTAGYALFQTANNTGVMAGIASDKRGLVSGMLNLARNLGLVTGASAMGTVFAIAASSGDIAVASSTAVAHGMRITFLVAAALVLAAIALTLRRRTAANVGPSPCVAASGTGR